jgi:hypothetical protein
MNNEMRTFSRDVESRLDKAYKQGATKKYGYDSITNLSLGEPSTGDASSKREDKILSKMQSQA